MHTIHAAIRPPSTTSELVFALCCLAAIMLVAAGVLLYTARSHRSTR